MSEFKLIRNPAVDEALMKGSQKMDENERIFGSVYINISLFAGELRLETFRGEFGMDVKEELLKISNEASTLARLARDAELILSGEIDEDEFLKRVKEVNK